MRISAEGSRSVERDMRYYNASGDRQETNHSDCDIADIWQEAVGNRCRFNEVSNMRKREKCIFSTKTETHPRTLPTICLLSSQSNP